MDLMAIDVAVLPPTDVTQRVMALCAALPASESHGLRLDAEHLPHITLAQLFVRASELDVALQRVDDVVGRQPPMRLRVSGASHSGATIWLTVDVAAPLTDVHERLMHDLHGIERPGGTAAAFVDGDARVGDVLWVASYRLKASFGSFTPHITVGHAKTVPHVEPFDFDATTIAACHLGRFCTCRRILRAWTLSATVP
jgi:2'-5' RNA ligase